MTNTNRNSVWRSTAAGLLVLAGGASAFAQASGQELQGSFNEPLNAPTAGASQVVMMQSDGTGTYKVEIKDGKVSAEVDGKAVPASRVKHRGDKVQILGEDGKVLATFDVATTPRAVGRDWNFTRNRVITPEPPVAPEAAAPEQPKVMVGIRMNDADGEVVIENVIEGLPAEKAGLKSGDVLVTVDGKKIENSLSLRSILRDKQPGDRVSVLVRRDGEEKTLAVELQAFRADKMGQSSPIFQAAPGQNWTTNWQAMGDSGQRWSEDARKAIEDALAKMKESPNGKEFRDDAQKALEQALQSLKAVPGQAGNAWRGLIVTPDGDPNNQWRGDRNVFRLGNGADLEQRLDKLDKQLDRLSHRLDELAKRLEDKGGR